MSINKKPSYETSFKEELEKIALFGFKQNSFSRKKKKKKSWKTKFASQLNIKVDEYNIGERLATGFARIIAKKGL